MKCCCFCCSRHITLLITAIQQQQKELASSWILIFPQPHWVTSGQITHLMFSNTHSKHESPNHKRGKQWHLPIPNNPSLMSLFADSLASTPLNTRSPNHKKAVLTVIADPGPESIEGVAWLFLWQRQGIGRDGQVEHFIPLDAVHLTCQEVGSIRSCRVQAAQGLLPMGIKQR